MAPDKTDSSGKVCHKDQTDPTNQKGEAVTRRSAPSTGAPFGICAEFATCGEKGGSLLNKPTQNTREY